MSARNATPLLVITNADAGTADEETLDGALDDPPRDGPRSRWPRPPTPASSTACCTAPGRDGSWWPAATAACTPWSALHRATSSASATLALLPMGTGNDFARGNDIPLDIEDAARLVVDGEARQIDLIVDEAGEVVVNNVHVGAGAAGQPQGRKWKTRLGAVGVGKVNLGKLGYPIGAVLSAFHPPSCACASRSTARSSTTSTGRC